MATKQPRMAKPINPTPRPAPKMAEVEAMPSMTPTPSMLSAQSHDEQVTLPIADEPEFVSPTPEVAESPAPAVAPEPAAPEPPPAPPAPVVEAQVEPDPPAAPATYPLTMREMFVRVDSAWTYFRVAAGAFPSERMDERLEDGWTRKQMLAHIGAWHDQTHDRLGTLILTGQPSESRVDTDSFNARVARQAIGRTAGEVLKEMEMTFNRLRRQLAGLTDEQLVAFDGWAARLIAGDTYEHYAEHAADVYQPPVVDGRSGRR